VSGIEELEPDSPSVGGELGTRPKPGETSAVEIKENDQDD